jgi:CRP/FNR family transcriptional regulator, cyclic AMP receptor protein
VCLLAAEPDLGRFLTADERAAAEQLPVPVHELARGALDINSALSGANAFAALILEGMLLRRLHVGDQPALRLLGPGDILSRSDNGPSLIAERRSTVAAPTRLAMLGNEVLRAARRWPRLVAGLHVQAAEQNERVETQLAICQLPRVEERLLSLMWLLAEYWGVVTAHGTRLPLAFTHDALGGMIGARRPTVTLALGELTDRGAIVRQTDGWLLLEGPPEPSGAPGQGGPPALLEDVASDWTAGPERRDMGSALEALRANLDRLDERHRHNAERFKEFITRSRRVRERAVRSRQRIARQALSRGRAPSS